MSWHYLQGREVASWAASSLDGAPCALSRLIPTRGVCSLHVSAMGSSIGSRYGTTSRRSTATRGAARSTSSVGAFPVRTSAALARVQVSMAPGQGCGWKWHGSFAKYDRASSSWRTRQCSLLGGLELYSETWPRWGSMRDGECLELTMPGHLTSVTGSGSWLATPTATANQLSPSMMKHPGCRAWLPTPTASPYGTRNNGRRGDGSTYRTAGAPSLQTMASRNLWPTPVKDDAEGRCRPKKPNQKQMLRRDPRLLNGGRLNPTWVEWLMGWPIGHTGLEPLETGRFQQWLHSHGVCSEAHDGS